LCLKTGLSIKLEILSPCANAHYASATRVRLQNFTFQGVYESELSNACNVKFCGDRISNFNGVVLSTQDCNNAIMLSVTNFIVMKIYNIGGDGHGTFEFISE
jgi:hypothetical protein